MKKIKNRNDLFLKEDFKSMGGLITLGFLDGLWVKKMRG